MFYKTACPSVNRVGNLPLTFVTAPAHPNPINAVVNTALFVKQWVKIPADTSCRGDNSDGSDRMVKQISRTQAPATDHEQYDCCCGCCCCAYKKTCATKTRTHKARTHTNTDMNTNPLIHTQQSTKTTQKVFGEFHIQTNILDPFS